LGAVPQHVAFIEGDALGPSCTEQLAIFEPGHSDTPMVRARASGRYRR